MSETRSPLQVVWSKRDLRAEDHAVLAAAAASGPVLPLFVAEPMFWQQPDCSARQWAFVAESLAELRDALGALGQPLVVRTGSVVDALDALRASHGIACLWSHEETGNGWTYTRDRTVAAWCRAHGIEWREVPQHGVVRRLRSRTGWAVRWDRFMAEPVRHAPDALPPVPGVEAGSIPAAADLGVPADPCPSRQTGGREAAVERLTSFLTARAENYRAGMASPVTAWKDCSRLSPHIAWGNLSMRETAQTTWNRQKAWRDSVRPNARVWRDALQSFAGRLHWHCHFMQKLEDEPRLEFEDLHPAYRGLRPAEPDPLRFAAWTQGETGIPFVDACMRALTATGWINFRMRAMLTSVASYHLWLPWRRTGEHLARLFTDYEPGIHWPQIQMQSGTTGINATRIYNPVKQGYDQDADGVFVRQWVPELADVPDLFIHEPWKWDKAGTVLDKDYPFPVVDHLAAAKQARQKIWSVRNADGHREEASRIVKKHASRSRRRGMRRLRNPPQPINVEAAQLSLLPSGYETGDEA